jgi:ribosome-interacting GTPase 1
MLNDTTVALREEYFRQGFVRIKEACKMESVEDIIHQHFVNIDTNVILNENKHLQAQRLTELQAQKAVLVGQLNLLQQANNAKTGLKELNLTRMKMNRVETDMAKIVKIGKDHKMTLTKVEHSLKHHLQRATRICASVAAPVLADSPNAADYLAVLTAIIVAARTECVASGIEDKPGSLVHEG